MIYVFLGQNFNIVNSKINTLINNLNIDNIIKYDMVDNVFDDVLNEVNYIDLFNEKKLVIVSNFSFKSLTEQEEERFIKYIDNMSENVIIIRCIDDSVDERRKLTKLLRAKCKIEIVQKLDYRDLHEYVKNMLVDAGIYADFNKIKKILDLCEYDPDFTINEVNKLIIYKDGENELTDKDIDDVITKNNDKEMYEFLDCITRKDIKGSLNSYKILKSSKIDGSVIIEMLARQFRMIGQVRHLKDEMNVEMIARKLGQKDFVINKLIPYVNNYNDEEIMDILYKLSDYDIDIKLNGKDSSYVVENFIMTYTLR